MVLKNSGHKELWWNYSVDDLVKKLKSDVSQGLEHKEAIRRYREYGSNKLPGRKRITPSIIFIRQFLSFIVWVLIGAATITWFLGNHVDAAAIIVIVILNAIMGFVLEYRAEQSLEALQKLTQPVSRVIRDGKEQDIPSEKLVPGDIVILKAGVQVPADGRIVDATQLSIQEAALTGESAAVTKVTERIPQQKLALGDRKNLTFMGTSVVNGKGLMIVIETALSTELGSISTLLQMEEEVKTPLQVKLNKLGFRLLILSFFIVVIIFIFGLVRGASFLAMIVTALSLAVAAIPEGLPAVMTIVLAMGVRRMSKRNTIVRRLSSVEALGGVSVICSDKTGTLTKNEMTVRSVWINNGFVEVTGTGYEPHGTFRGHQGIIDVRMDKTFFQLLKIGVLCNNARLHKKNGRKWKIEGDPTEVALLTLAGKAGLWKETFNSRATMLWEIPFSSDRKRMSVCVKESEGIFLLIKGAADVLLQRSSKILIEGSETSLTSDYKDNIIKTSKKMASQSLRVLGLAYRSISSKSFSEELENELIFVGLVGMVDPPREGVKNAIESCNKAGIQTVMITGDYMDTAVAIARELGIMKKGSVAIEGLELEQISDLELEKKIDQITVYSRVAVKQKLRIIKLLKSIGKVVAMTGDGVNDAPAVKAADVGIAMGITGTDVTKEASDMIIMDDNFTTIVDAVEEGRGIYSNIVKFINYLVSSNIAEIMVIFIGVFFGFVDLQGKPFLSLLPVQLLWINLVTDGPLALALGLDPIDPGVMDDVPRNPAEPIFTVPFFVRLLLIGVIMAFGTIIACHFGLSVSASLAHTMAFTTLIVLELVRITMVRQQSRCGVFSNMWLIAALVSSLVLQLAIIYVPPLQNVFNTVSLGFIHWIVVLAVAGSVWAIVFLLVRFLPITYRLK